MVEVIPIVFSLASWDIGQSYYTKGYIAFKCLNLNVK